MKDGQNQPLGNELRRSRMRLDRSLSQCDQFSETPFHFRLGVVQIHALPLVPKLIAQPRVDCLKSMLEASLVGVRRQWDARVFLENKFIDSGLLVTEEHQKNIIKVHELFDRACRLAGRAKQAKIVLSWRCGLFQFCLQALTGETALKFHFLSINEVIASCRSNAVLARWGRFYRRKSALDRTTVFQGYVVTEGNSVQSSHMDLRRNGHPVRGAIHSSQVNSGKYFVSVWTLYFDFADTQLIGIKLDYGET